jgi:AcrR family transcriptional regulator
MQPERIPHSETRKTNLSQFIAAGRHVFATIGYDAATARDIVKQSGLAQGSFYNYFSNKRALFETILAQIFEPLIPLLKAERQKAISPYEFLFNAFEACYVLPLNEPETAAIISRNQTIFRELFYISGEQNQIREDLRVDLEKWQAEGKFSHFDSGMMADAMISLGLDLVVQTAKDRDAGKARLVFLAELFLPRLVPDDLDGSDLNARRNP